MKRSEINRHQKAALDLFTTHRFALPPFALWRPAEVAANPETARFRPGHQMGLEITDFGSGDFSRRRLTGLCVRNGLQADAASRPYAEKLLVVGEGQETPSHSHRIK